MRRVRVRFAPSPTGPLHIGGVRTALYNFLFARKNNGDMLLRIEDTDSSRFVPGAEDYIVESLKWLGITIDEGVGAEKEGAFGPYRQSERKTIYRKYVDQLLNSGKAYIAFDSPIELESKRAEIPNFQYDAGTRLLMNNSLTLPEEEVRKRIENNEQYVVRIKIEPGEEIVVNDLIRGEVTINSSVIDDKVIFKSVDELPTYHLANVVDDYLMQITHVIRGEEWLPSSPLHILLYRYLGWENEMPQFAHLPLLLKPDGKGKLSKRDGDRLGFPVFPLNWKDPRTGEIYNGFREAGYFPEAVVNFLALLGWNPGTEQEIFSMDELIEQFSLERVSKSGAKFDYEKAKWFNHKYLQMKPDEEVADIFQRILIEKGFIEDTDKVIKIISLIKDRADFITDLWDQSHYFFEAPEHYDAKAVQKRWKPEIPKQLDELCDILLSLEAVSSEEMEKIIKEWISKKNYHLGNLMNALRLVLVGELKGPSIFEIIEVLGTEETVRRIRKAIEVLDKEVF
ncbi:MAG TPA: glutamate--tRNA ligase [Paludibacteraceae bacterium]|jgi:glutamyl-tRNA synthetase|nr:glutamate--tRNA ligase [Paludibacteraceae bacterium]MDS1032238.1 glutamate--tRNA ligase [Porphyromonadaceae sp. NP-X]HNZ61369.1 glutamate--tRNA ligase [Paludibacteraceae bacterium]HOH54896.1 glutamate--tRNA ligase [Paludibacteraceae bacterium]